MTVVDDIRHLIVHLDHGGRAGECSGPGECDVSPLGEGDNWLKKVNGLPLYIRAIAHALRRSGHSESEAISIAVATVKRWAAGGGKVSAATRARAAKAVAEWEAKKAASHARADVTEKWGKRAAVTEWGSGGPGTTGPAGTNYDPSQAGSLLPRGLARKPHPDEAHGFRGADLTSCAVCGRPVAADVHRQPRTTGQRASGAYASGHQFFGNQYMAAAQSGATPAQLQQLAAALAAGSVHVGSGGGHAGSSGAGHAGKSAASKAKTAAKHAAAKQAAAHRTLTRKITAAEKGIAVAKAHAEAARARAGQAKTASAREHDLGLAEKYQAAATKLQDVLNELRKQAGPAPKV